jgi:hypothetical protein
MARDSSPNATAGARAAYTPTRRIAPTAIAMLLFARALTPKEAVGRRAVRGGAAVY